MKANIAMELIMMPANAMANPNTHPKGVKSNNVWSGFESIFSDCKASIDNHALAVRRSTFSQFYLSIFFYRQLHKVLSTNDSYFRFINTQEM